MAISIKRDPLYSNEPPLPARNTLPSIQIKVPYLYLYLCRAAPLPHVCRLHTHRVSPLVGTSRMYPLSRRSQQLRSSSKASLIDFVLYCKSFSLDERQDGVKTMAKWNLVFAINLSSQPHGPGQSGLSRHLPCQSSHCNSFGCKIMQEQTLPLLHLTEKCFEKKKQSTSRRARWNGQFGQDLDAHLKMVTLDLLPVSHLYIFDQR